MQNAAINLTHAARCVQLFRVNGHSATREKTLAPVASCEIAVGGYDWVIQYFPCVRYSSEYWLVLRFALSSDGASNVAATFRCRLVDQDQANQTAAAHKPSRERALTSTFCKGQPKDLYLMSRNKVADIPGLVQDDTLLIECTITVLLDAPPVDTTAAAAAAAAAAAPQSVPAPLSDMQKHFGEILTSKKGADITFLVSGESITAHRCVLAARSPVFMAELLGDMKEKESQCIEIKDMDTEVFRTLLHFIYTDTLPEQADDESQTTAHHLLEAADRYGMERLKLICAEKVHADISVDTVATAMALAERHGCTKLKARCIEFMLASRENFRAVAATEGYKLLMDSCPSALNDLLVAVFLNYKPFCNTGSRKVP